MELIFLGVLFLIVSYPAISAFIGVIIIYLVFKLISKIINYLFKRYQLSGLADVQSEQSVKAVHNQGDIKT